MMENTQTAKLYQEYSPKVQQSSSIYPLWKQIEDSFEFRDQPEEIQFLQLLKRFNETILSMPEASSIEIEKQFITKELGRARFKIVSDDFFNTLEEGDIIEVITLENIQLYRNFEYFKYSSYSITELIHRPWQELFLRDDSVVQQILGEIIETIKLDPKGCKKLKLPVHNLREAGGKQFTFEINYKYACPVLDRYNNKTAFAVSQTARRLNNEQVISFH